MPKEPGSLNQLLFQFGEDTRWTQDSPILPDVWNAMVAQPSERVDLLVTPHRNTRPGELATRIRDLMTASSRKGTKRQKSEDLEEALSRRIAHNQSAVAVRANFEELVTILAPLSQWYEKSIGSQLAKVLKYSTYQSTSRKLQRLRAEMQDPKLSPAYLPSVVVWWLRLIGEVSILVSDDKDQSDGEQVLDCALQLLSSVPEPSGSSARLYRIALNRRPRAACLESIRTVKADAAEQVFRLDTGRICWAVVDTGIDARHPAFYDANEETRVQATYDFTRVRRLLVLASTPGDAAEAQLQQEFGLTGEQAQNIRTALAASVDVDWELLTPALEVQHSGATLDQYVDGFMREDNTVVPGISPHGTHVAGILGGLPSETADGSFAGMCPNIRLIDLRVLDEKGEPGEFDIMAALQFVRHLNSASDELVVHGVNLSIQLDHDPRNFACGQTPVCEECDRLVSNGVVVVAAAGNRGIDRTAADSTTTEGAFRSITIADPGNAEAVLTVGSTHRKRPHAYGVSFFSSRGPTGDGRQKPDLVAPGERILSPVTKGEYARLDGTSQAAPHVSGAAALLMARHTELIGKPQRVKAILCSTATDLGRERHFQGAGLVDILRALQSV